MATIREQIIEAITAAVNTGAPSGFPNCVRTLMQPFESAQLPNLTCFPFRESVDSRHSSGRFGPLVTRDLYLRFLVFGMGQVENTDESLPYIPGDQSVDAIIARLVQVLLADVTLGGLASSITEHECNWSYDEGNYLVAAAALDFKIEYQTLRVDPTRNV